MKADLVITATWPDDNPDDVDLYVEDPEGNVVWYYVKEAGLIHLDRDDRGNYKDTITVNGKEIQNPFNQETSPSEGSFPGNTSSMSTYSSRTADQVPVRVKVEKLNPRLQVVYYGTLKIDHKGQEETSVRFTVDSEGNVGDVNTRSKSLIKAVRARAAERPAEIG